MFSSVHCASDVNLLCHPFLIMSTFTFTKSVHFDCKLESALLFRGVDSFHGLLYNDVLSLVCLVRIIEAYFRSCSFSARVNSTIALLHPLHCTRDRKVEVEFDMTTIPAFLVVFLILWLVLKPKRAKPKIN